MSRLGLFLSLLLLLVSPHVAAEYLAHGPVSLRSQNPLTLLFLSPRPERAVVLPKGTLRLAARGPYSNLFEQGFSPSTGVRLDLDMELFRPSFLVEWGVASGWEVGLELPFLHFEGGFLDAGVQDFHDVFGLPNGGRGAVPHGRFAYAVRQNGRVLYQVGTEAFRPSDLVFHVKRALLQESSMRPGLSGTFYLKVPSGKRGEGLGSGAPDIGVNLAVEKHYKRLHAYANLGGVLFGATNLGLEPFLNPAIWNWMTALEITAWSHHLSVIAQLQGDGSLFDGTGIQELDQGNLNLTIGFAGQEGPWGWKAGFMEDPSGQGPAVDFTTYVEVSYTWGL